MNFASDGQRAHWRATLARHVLRVALIGWAVFCLTIVSSLAVAHSYELPRPSAHDARLLRALAAQRSQAGALGGWSATHVLYARCACSRRVVDTLIARGPVSPFREVVLMVDGEMPRAETLRGRGFSVQAISAADLRKVWGIEAAPLLLVTAPDETVRYAGGYSERKQDTMLRDRAILERARAGATVNPLPAFGCAVSESLRRLVDPWGLKYRRGAQP